MSTKRELQLIIGIVFFLTIFFIVFLFATFTSYQGSLNDASLASRIAVNVFKRRLIAEDYLAHPGERSKSQWTSAQATINQIVTDAKNEFQATEEQALIRDIRTQLSESEDLFQQLVALQEQPATQSDPTLFQDKKQSLDAQLSVKTQEIISSASNLETINTNDATHALTQLIFLSITAIVFYALMITICFLIIWRNTRLLERKESETDAILDSIGDGVFAVDKSGKIVFFNRAAEVLSGYTQAEAVNKQYSDVLVFYHQEKGEQENTFIRDALAGNKSHMSAHTFIQKKDHTSLPVADTAAPITTPAGTDGAVVVFRDISAEIAIEKMKDEFLSMASHELRTPMTAIRGLISMIFDGDYGPISENLRAPLSDVSASTTRLINLVNDLLDVSRIEAGRIKFTLTALSIAEPINQVIGTLQPLVKEKKITLTGEHLPTEQVQGDINKIQQIINNVVGNAIKFTDAGGITVTAEVKDDLMRIFITDTGIGIPADKIGKLFGRFEQIGGEKAGRPPGTGLGLYISKQLAQKMGGDVWIEKSEPNVGTTFGFSLPLANSAKAVTIKQAIEKEALAHPDQK